MADNFKNKQNIAIRDFLNDLTTVDTTTINRNTRHKIKDFKKLCPTQTENDVALFKKFYAECQDELIEAKMSKWLQEYSEKAKFEAMKAGWGPHNIRRAEQQANEEIKQVKREKSAEMRLLKAITAGNLSFEPPGEAIELTENIIKLLAKEKLGLEGKKKKIIEAIKKVDLLAGNTSVNGYYWPLAKEISDDFKIKLEQYKQGIFPPNECVCADLYEEDDCPLLDDCQYEKFIDSMNDCELSLYHIIGDAWQDFWDRRSRIPAEAIRYFEICRIDLTKLTIE